MKNRGSGWEEPRALNCDCIGPAVAKARIEVVLVSELANAATVEKYLFHIFEKLGISSRVEFVLYAISRGRLEAL